MKPYTENEPVFSEFIQVTEPTDPAHADNINAAPKQLLQNTLVNRKAVQEMEQGNQTVEFEDYSGEGAEVPDPEEAVNQVASGKADKVFRQYVKASLKGMLNLVQRALSIAMGKNQARVFATVEALDAWLAVPANVQQLNVGDNFYITATDVPDYWWDGKQKQKLETQKVDLTTYDQRISELYGNISPIIDSKVPNWSGDVMMSRDASGFDRANDANNFVKTGIYRTETNTKNAADWGYIAVHGYPDWIWQEWHKTNGEIYTRRKINDSAWTAWIASLARGNLSYTHVNMNERKNHATVGTVSSCHLNYNDFMAIVNFGLFQVSSNLNSEDVEIFTLPDNIFPISETFFVVTSAHGDTAKCRIRTNRQIVMDRTPGTSIYYGGQAVFFR